jgi:acetate kinase
MALLALNAGSATLKAAWFDAPGAPARWRARLDLARGELHAGGRVERLPVARDVAGGCGLLLAALERAGLASPRLVVHRVVHGGTRFSAPVEVDDAVVCALAALAPLAPLHQPANLSALAAARAAFPAARHVACFDTAFHADWPDAARRFALPRRLHEAGIRRYGFHGLAHAHAARMLRAMLPDARRAVVAHLGGGSSLCALADFASVDCSMGYSPLDGLPMGTRCGAIDPGVLLELAGPRGMAIDALSRLLYRESGLLGVSGLSADLRDLLASDAPEARQAIDLYVHQLVRGIGAMAASLGGLDALVFSGGIGEHAAPIRAAACARLGFLGVAIDAAANAAHAPVLEAAGSRVAVRIVACDEEAEMAREAFALPDGAPRD